MRKDYEQRYELINHYSFTIGDSPTKIGQDVSLCNSIEEVNLMKIKSMIYHDNVPHPDKTIWLNHLLNENVQEAEKIYEKYGNNFELIDHQDNLRQEIKELIKNCTPAYQAGDATIADSLFYNCIKIRFDNCIKRKNGDVVILSSKKSVEYALNTLPKDECKFVWIPNQRVSNFKPY